MSDSYLEKKFAKLWELHCPDLDLHSEYRVSKKRRFRADFCCPKSKVVVEIQGGIWQEKSSHSTGVGITRDCEKACFYATEGYLYFPLAPKMVNTTYVLVIADVIRQRLELN